MDVDRVASFLSQLSFRQAVWLFPLAFLLHVLEEYPHFATWAQQNASAAFTRQDYIQVHAVGIVLAFVSAALVSLFPNQFVVLTFFALVFTPAVFFNVLFHAGATAVSGAYSPGLLTALTIYLPLFYFLSHLAYAEGRITNPPGMIAFIVAAAVHTADVGHNVYKLW
jgi:hypothetical protein